MTVFALLLSVLVPACSYGQSFKEANQLYKEGRYEQAVEYYESALKQGFESGNLYYNLGNSYFKKGELGRALLNYERAKFFIPHDSDLRSNHDFVRSALDLPKRYSREKWFFRWLDRLFDDMGANGLTLLISAMWISLLALLSAALFMPALKRPSAWLGAFLAVFLIICSIALARKISYYEHGAIVITKEAQAKFEPADSATTYFKLTEGASVMMIDRSQDWVKVRRPDSKIGWVQAASIEKIKN
ncbi:MAG: tetratricopeptide repeat protein [Candidatus Omnitrophica bacterium]|nr:tetratricopeptide repeat protein [Candidatus Omnitrophota bacterium]